MRSSLSRSQMLAAAAAVSLLPYRAGAQSLEKIRLAGVPTDDLTPVYYAIRNGLYQRAGLDVEVVPTSSGTAATTAIIAGTYELGKGSLIATLVAHLRGLPLVLVANTIVHEPKSTFALTLVAADSPIRTGADLNGKVAAAPALNDLNQLCISAWVDKNGGDSRTLKWTEVPNSVAGPALVEHRIDVANVMEPQLSADLEGGKLRVLGVGYSAISEHFVFGGYFANTDWAIKHADAIKRWVRVTYEAGAYTNAHHPETVALMAEVTKIPLAVMQKIGRAEAATNSDPSLLQPLIDMAAKYKQIPRAFPAKELYFTG